MDKSITELFVCHAHRARSGEDCVPGSRRRRERRGRRRPQGAARGAGAILRHARAVRGGDGGLFVGASLGAAIVGAWAWGEAHSAGACEAVCAQEQERCRLDLLRDPLAERFLRHGQLIGGLEVDPEHRAGAKEAGAPADRGAASARSPCCPACAPCARTEPDAGGVRGEGSTSRSAQRGSGSKARTARPGGPCAAHGDCKRPGRRCPRSRRVGDPVAVQAA